MSKTTRSSIIKILTSKLGARSAANYETAIYELANDIAVTEDIDFDAAYSAIAYEKCGELMKTSSKEEQQLILKDMHEGVHGWNSVMYDEQKQNQLLLNQKLQDKGKLVKGAFYCRDKVRCKSDECFSYQSQTKSSDEGMSTFVICSKCGLRYKFG